MTDQDTPATDSAQQHKSLNEALLAVCREVGYIEFDAKFMDQFSYASEEAMLRRVRPVLLKHGVMFSPANHREIHYAGIELVGGKPTAIIIGKFSFLLTHVPSGDSRVVTVIADGVNGNPKAGSTAMMAETSATRSFLRRALMLATGADQEKWEAGQQEAENPNLYAKTEDREKTKRRVAALKKCENLEQLDGYLQTYQKPGEHTRKEREALDKYAQEARARILGKSKT